MRVNSGGIASYNNEIIVDLLLIYYTEEITLSYENPQDNIHCRTIPPMYPCRTELRNSRRIKRVERLLDSWRNRNYALYFAFNGNSFVYCN